MLMSLGLTNVDYKGSQCYPSIVSDNYLLLYIGKQVREIRPLHSSSSSGNAWLMHHISLNFLPPKCSNIPLSFLP